MYFGPQAILKRPEKIELQKFLVISCKNTISISSPVKYILFRGKIHFLKGKNIKFRIVAPICISESN